MEKSIVPNSLIMGKQAEQKACQFLQSQGLELLEQNYRCFQGEIDLIMQDKHSIVFVEVRWRSRVDYGTALESVNTRKQNKLIKAAAHFLQKKKWLYQVNSRFDIIGIHFLSGKSEFEWVKNAFSINDQSGL